MYRITKILILTLAIGIINVETNTFAQEETNDVFTGCLTQDGAIIKVAIGTEPAKPCKGSQKQISWNAQGVPGTDGQDGMDAPIVDCPCDIDLAIQMFTTIDTIEYTSQPESGNNSSERTNGRRITIDGRTADGTEITMAAVATYTNLTSDATYVSSQTRNCGVSVREEGAGPGEFLLLSNERDLLFSEVDACAAEIKALDE